MKEFESLMSFFFLGVERHFVDAIRLFGLRCDGKINENIIKEAYADKTKDKDDITEFDSAYALLNSMYNLLPSIRTLLLVEVEKIHNEKFSNHMVSKQIIDIVIDKLMNYMQNNFFNFIFFEEFLKNRENYNFDGLYDGLYNINGDFESAVVVLLYEGYEKNPDFIGYHLYPRILELVKNENLSGKIIGMLIETPEDFREWMTIPDALQYKVCEAISVLLVDLYSTSPSHSFDKDMLRSINKRLNYKVSSATKIQRAWRAHRDYQLNEVVPYAYRLINNNFGDDTRFLDFLNTTSRGEKQHILCTRRFCSADCFTRRCGNPTCAKGSNLRGKSYFWLAKDVCEYDSTRRSDMADLMMGLYYFVSYGETFRRKYQPTQFNITSDRSIAFSFYQIGRIVKEAVDSAPSGKLIHDPQLILASSMILALVEFIRSIPKTKFSFQGLVDDIRRATWDIMPDEVLDVHFALFGSSRLTAQPRRHVGSTHGKSHGFKHMNASKKKGASCS